MAKINLKVESRSVLGRKVKTLRKEGLVPGNIYGNKVKSFAIQFKLSEFVKVFESAGETNIVELAISAGKTKKADSRSVLISNIQVDPVTDTPIHVDFHQVDLKVKVTAQVPVEVIGESPAEKQGLGTVVTYIDEVEVEALPMDLPDKFEVDLSKLTEIDQAVHIKDLGVDTKKVEVKIDSEEIVIKIEPLRKEEEEPEPVEEEGVESAEDGEADEGKEGEEGGSEGDEALEEPKKEKE